MTDSKTRGANGAVRLAACALLMAAGLLVGMTRVESGPAERPRRAHATMPRAWMEANEALALAHRQTGLRYAVVPAEFNGVVGPYQIGQRVRVARLVRAVAAATGTHVRFVDETAVFESERPARGWLLRRPQRPDDPREAVQAAAETSASDDIAFLSKKVGHSNASVRAHALHALHRMEGDFEQRQWPGRVSVFEVFPEELNRDTLYWAMQERYPAGSSNWRKVVDILARARDPHLGRNTWGALYYERYGALQAAMWGLGRSGDHSVASMLNRRIRWQYTSDPLDRYRAAIGIGTLNRDDVLRQTRNTEHENPEVRAAIALALGLCEGTDDVLETLSAFMQDADPRVRFVACQSLGRIGTEAALDRLEAALADPETDETLLASVLDGLGRAATPRAVALVAQRADDGRPAVRVKVAEVLGAIGGEQALTALKPLLDDADRQVQVAAASAVATFGTQETVELAGERMAEWDDDLDSRIAVVTGMGCGRSPAAAEWLAPVALDTDASDRLRYYASLALARLAQGAGRDTLKTLTDFDAPQYLPYAIEHVDLGDPEATFEHLKPLLTQGGRDTQAAAAWRASQLGSGKATVELLEGSGVLDNHARFKHGWGPMHARGPEIVPALVEASHSRRAQIRSGAAQALSGRMDVRAVDRLIELTEDGSAGVRASAAHALGLTGDPAAIDALVAMATNESNRRARNVAVRALRSRVFRGDERVRACFAELAGTERDNGVIDPNLPSVAGQPAHSFALRRFADSVDDEDMCSITYETSLPYDRARGRVVLWGAHGRFVDSPQTGETWFFDAGRNSWERLIFSREWPGEDCCIWGTTYDRAQRVVVSPVSGTGGGHGWGNALRGHLQSSFPWVLDTRTDQWYAMKPPHHYGRLNMVAGTSDPIHGLAIFSHGRVVTYDIHANRWDFMTRGTDGPGRNIGNTGGVFHPASGRLIAVGRRSTWSYDPVEDRWADLKPEGDIHPHGWMMVHDTANDVMLAFRRGGAGMRVAVYHIDENRWEELPPTWPRPNYGAFDVTYDERRNVTVISGGNDTWRSAESAVRETWTYRYKPADGPVADPHEDRPRDVAVTVSDNGAARVTWQRPREGAPEQFRVYRGYGERVWRAEWTAAGEVEADVLSFEDQIPNGEEHPNFYRVLPVTGDNEEGTPSYPASAAPPALRRVSAARTDGGIRVVWHASPADGVVGYHVYRAPVPEANYWRRRFDPWGLRLGDKMERLTDEPVSGTEWLDEDVPAPQPGSEEWWPETFAYIVQPINAWGVEAGPSPVTLAVPSPPELVRVVPFVDGVRMVLWGPGHADDSAGWHVMRQDSWHLHYAFRWNAVPTQSHGWLDRDDYPASSRRRYYVYGVDAHGTVGIPSSGLWSDGYP